MSNRPLFALTSIKLRHQELLRKEIQRLEIVLEELQAHYCTKHQGQETAIGREVVKKIQERIEKKREELRGLR